MEPTTAAEPKVQEPMISQNKIIATFDELKELYVKQGIIEFYLLVNDQGRLLHFYMKALNVFSLYAQLLSVLPTLGITQFWILDKAATTILAEAQMESTMQAIQKPLGHRIIAAKQQIDATLRAMNQGQGRR